MKVDEDSYRLLLRLAADDAPESRGAVFGSVSRILVEDIQADQDRERSLAADILLRLVRDVEVRLRWELASHLATREDAPPSLIVTLASDNEIEVARPVLMESPLLSDAELIRIVHEKSQGHRLAVARRKALSAEVSGDLARSGEPEVVVTLIRNGGAVLDEATMTLLVEQSQWEVAYREPLIQRDELPKALARRLYRWVGKPLKDYIRCRYNLNFELLAEDIERIIDQELEALDDSPEPVPRVGPAAAGLDEAAPPSAGALVAALEKGDTAHFEELLAAAAGLGVTQARRLAYDPSGAGLIVACHIARVDEPTFARLYDLTRQKNGEPALPDPAARDLLLANYRAMPEDLTTRIAALRAAGARA